MKDICKYEHYFEEYFSGDLSKNEQLKLIKHLQTCRNCRTKIDEFYNTFYLLKNIKRPLPLPSLVRDYHQQLENEFASPKFRFTIQALYEYFFSSHQPFFRLAQLILILSIGVIVGWFLFAPIEKPAISPSNEPYHLSRPISAGDIDYIYYYLVASEMVLLEIRNSNDQSDFSLNRELAQKLLIKTFRVHETALRLNNLRLLNFLSRMELILHDVSNLNNQEITDYLVTIKMVINETNLLPEVKYLQDDMKRSRQEGGT